MKVTIRKDGKRVTLTGEEAQKWLDDLRESKKPKKKSKKFVGEKVTKEDKEETDEQA